MLQNIQRKERLLDIVDPRSLHSTLGRSVTYEMLHLTWITKALATQWQPWAWLSIRFDDLPKLAFVSLERS